MNELRKEIEPNFETAEKLYPEVLKLILSYAEYCDENGDESNSEYQKLENKLKEITKKDISRYNLWEWWEEEGAEVLAFKISLPNAKKIENIKKAELAEIVRRKKTFEIPNEDNKDFKAEFYYYLDDYYDNFFKLNFKTYDQKIFQRNKDKNGNYFEYSIEETVEKLWSEEHNE